MEILKNIPIELDENEIAVRLHIGEESQDRKEFRDLLDRVQSVMNPKAVYTVSFIEEKQEDKVIIDGAAFLSRILRVNLDSVNKVFPYIVTCGKELDELADSTEDVLQQYYLDEIKGMVVIAASEYLFNYLQKKYQLGKIARMNPGSLEDWPISQQKPLFSLFGDVEDMIGVRLTDSCLMVPIKSVSGMVFPTQVTYENCQLCPREGCPGRRAAYNEKLASSYFKE